MTIALLSSLIRPMVEPHLPEGVEPHWFASTEELMAMAPKAEIGWFDLDDKAPMIAAVKAAENLKWLNSIYAGLDFLPLDVLQKRGTRITNGAGINAIAIAEYVVMGMLNIAKDYRSIVTAQQQRNWLMDAPGKQELVGSKALLLGFGAIGGLVKPRLEAMGVDVTPVRRSPRDGALGPDEWRECLGEFDWVILAVPATKETENMIGADELAAMKPNACLINVARGNVVDQEALIAALRDKTSDQRIGSAFLDVTTPEPLPADHPLWNLDNAHITMHLSGRAQNSMFIRSAERFLRNIKAYMAGDEMESVFDPVRGY